MTHKYTWLGFSQSYLQTSSHLCGEMMKNSKKIQSFFLPSLYNLKHGIECYLKTVDVILEKELSKDLKKHNIHELFQSLEKKIKSKKTYIELRLKEMKESSSPPTPGINIHIALDALDNLDQTLSDAKKLINKYYSCAVIKDKIETSFTIEDPNNTAFRYPTADMRIQLDHGSIIKKIEKQDLEEMKRDADNAQEIFNSIGFMLDIAYTEDGDTLPY